jgi:DNA ligase-associated metallophosphoesterase
MRHERVARAQDLAIPAGGDTLVLCPEHAAFWPAARTLMVADAHFGKAASFRARGVAVPEATTGETLAKLDALIARHDPARIVFLGDFLHAREAHARQTIAALEGWRERHRALELVLVEGNHDLHAGAPPAALQVECMTEPWPLGPWALCHHPQAVSGRFVLAGHLHPALRVAGRSESVRLPCFWFGAGTGVLPAFGAFTGAHGITPAEGDRVFVVAEDRVLPVPARRAAA